MELRGLEGRLLLRRAARKWWLEYFDDDAKGYALWNPPTLVEEILGLAPRACDKSNSPPAPRLREAKNPP